MKAGPATISGVPELIRSSAWTARLELSEDDRDRMAAGVDVLSAAMAAGERIYGVTQGFGPLVRFQPDNSSADVGMGLISHLAAGQGAPLSPAVTRLMVWFRLEGMKRGHSAVSPDRWLELARLWNLGFTPVVPREGSLSASGDLAPLAHAALAFAGIGDAWSPAGTTPPEPLPAASALDELGAEPFAWNAREALAFVNGTSASLALSCHNHAATGTMARAAAALTGRIAWLLGCNSEPYAEQLALVRGHAGHFRASEWIRSEIAAGPGDGARPIQEPYSLRCAPQVIGAVLEQLHMQEATLVQEASGCTDNPVVVGGRILHGGNFHALGPALASDQLALCVHQLAFLAERQLAILLDPAQNGGLPPMLTPSPGRASGLAGVQLSASSLVARIRQLSSPATLTALPTNLGNQDIVPMALNGANAVAESIELAWLVVGSLTIAVLQLSYLQHERRRSPDHDINGIWDDLQASYRPLVEDRPLATEVREAAEAMREMAERLRTS